LLFRVVGPTRRGRATGLFQSGFLIGGLLGPLLGGFLTDVSLRLPFYVYALSLIAAGSIASLFLSKTRLRASETSGKSREVAEAVESSASRSSLRYAWNHRAY